MIDKKEEFNIVDSFLFFADQLNTFIDDPWYEIIGEYNFENNSWDEINEKYLVFSGLITELRDIYVEMLKKISPSLFPFDDDYYRNELTRMINENATTKEMSDYLNIKAKKIYYLISKYGLRG